MSDSLRDRIAAVLWRCDYGKRIWERATLTEREPYYDDADAVIAELALRPERGWGNGSRQTTRYVTDWKADDE